MVTWNTERWIIEQNIDRLQIKLENEQSAEAKTEIKRLLAAEQQKLRALRDERRAG